MDINIKVHHSFEQPVKFEEMLVRIHNRQEELMKLVIESFHHLNHKIMGFAEDLDAKLSAIDDKLTQAAEDSTKIKQGVEDLKTAIKNSNLTKVQQDTLNSHADKILGAVSDLDAGLEGIDTTAPDTTGTTGGGDTGGGDTGGGDTGGGDTGGTTGGDTTNG